MTERNKRIIVPVIVVICISLYYFIGTTILIRLNVSMAMKIIALIFSKIITVLYILILVSFMVASIERIREIKQGEEDDLGKY